MIGVDLVAAGVTLAFVGAVTSLATLVIGRLERHGEGRRVGRRAPAVEGPET